MTSPLAEPHVHGPFKVDDLDDLPDNGLRYEIFDGSLLVSPPAEFPHAGTASRLHRLLVRQLPDDVMVVENVGVHISDKKYYVPDLVVIRDELFRGEAGRRLRPADIELVVEIVSPNNPSNDLVLKRHAYASAGIQEYWIIDQRDRTLAVHRLDASGSYAIEATVRPAERWESDTPFPVTVDPAEVFPP